MVVRSVTVELPEHVFDVLRQRADESKRSVQEEVVDLLEAKLADETCTVESLEDALDGLATLSDNELWQAARKIFPQDLSDRTADLNFKQQRDGLSRAERGELKSLLVQYERHMLIRGKAMALLKQRGHDIAPLLVPPRP